MSPQDKIFFKTVFGLAAVAYIIWFSVTHEHWLDLLLERFGIKR